MGKNSSNILALNPGSKYLGIAIFCGSDLRYWAIKVLRGKWSDDKIKKTKEVVSELIDHYDLNFLAIKKLHPSRTSPSLKQIATKIKDLSKRKGLKIFQYSLPDLKGYFASTEKINKLQMADAIISHYPFLIREFEREKRNKNSYYIRLFEAIALGMVCFNQLDQVIEGGGGK